MRAKLLSSLCGGILLFGLYHAAFATQEEDFDKAYQNFMDADFTASTKMFTELAEQNYLPAQTQLGEMLLEGTEYNEALGWFLTSAFQGDARGQYFLGQMYGNGFGVEKSPSKAFYWTKKSAEQNYLPAVKLLSLSYRPVEGTLPEGMPLPNAFLGVEANSEQAEFWSAKLPALEKEERRIRKKEKEARDKKRAEEAEKAKEAQSKLLCGLKC
jgi:TPR repeat protein